MKHKSIIFYLFLTFLLPTFFTNHLYAQSYKVESVITRETVLVPGSDLFLRATFGDNLSINNNGDFVFWAVLEDRSNLKKSAAIIMVSNGEIKVLVNSPVNRVVKRPSGENEFDYVSSPDINDAGTVVFFAETRLDRKSTFKGEIYKFDEVSFTPLVSPGDPVNGLEATIAVIDNSSRLSLNNRGDVVFNAFLSDGNKGLFLFTEEGIQPVVLSGATFPVFSGNEILDIAFLPIINDKKEIVFLAIFFNSDNNPTDRSSGVFLYRDGEIIPVKLPGEDAPGTNGMVFLDGHGSWVSLGNNSEVVFRGEYMVPGGDSNNMEDRSGSGVFSWSEGEIKPLALTGDMIDGVRSSILGNPGAFLKDSINDSGEIVASLSTAHSGGVFLFSDDNVIPAVLTKDTRREIDQFILTGSAAINNNGDIVFLGTDILGLGGVFQAIKK